MSQYQDFISNTLNEALVSRPNNKFSDAFKAASKEIFSDIVQALKKIDGLKAQAKKDKDPTASAAAVKLEQALEELQKTIHLMR